MSSILADPARNQGQWRRSGVTHVFSMRLRPVGSARDNVWKPMAGGQAVELVAMRR